MCDLYRPLAAAFNCCRTWQLGVKSDLYCFLFFSGDICILSLTILGLIVFFFFFSRVLKQILVPDSFFGIVKDMLKFFLGFLLDFECSLRLLCVHCGTTVLTHSRIIAEEV